MRPIESASSESRERNSSHRGGFSPESPESTEPDDASVAGIFRELWAKKIVLAILILPFLAMGTYFALTKKPRYYSEATLSPKAEGGGNSLLSQLGGMGGMISTQLGLAGSGMEHLQILFSSRDIAESVLVKHDLNALLFKGKDNKVPSVKRAAEMLRGHLQVSAEKKFKVIYVGAVALDSVLARNLVLYYLDEVSLWISNQARRESEGNRRYLESQLSTTSDPLVREKVQQLIGMEIEKSILLGSKPFNVLETPKVPFTKYQSRRLRTVVQSVSLGFFFSCAVILAFNRRRRFLSILRGRGR